MSTSSDIRGRWLGAITLILCIGILWALLMPAMRSPRVARRRPQCLNNLKNLALATVNFETTQKEYPGYQSSFGKRGDGSEKIGTWVVSLLPMLEQQALRDRWDDPSNNDTWLTAVRDKYDKLLEEFYPQIKIMICPADTLLAAKFAGLSYAANVGFHLMPNDPALGMELYANAADAMERSTISQRSANGIFANRLGPDGIDPQTGELAKVFGYHPKPTRSTDVRDGLSQTILFAENCNDLSWQDFSIADESSRSKVGVVWLYAGQSASEGRPKPMAVTNAMRLNHNKLYTGSGPTRARPSGMHPGVIVTSFADGSTKSIDEEVDYHVYQSLMAPHDATSDIPDRSYQLREDDFLQ